MEAGGVNVGNTRVITDILPGYTRHTSGRRSVGFVTRLSHEPRLYRPPVCALKETGDSLPGASGRLAFFQTLTQGACRRMAVIAEVADVIYRPALAFLNHQHFILPALGALF